MSSVAVSELVASADISLHGVVQSMLEADLPRLEGSRLVLERIVRDLTEVKGTVSSGCAHSEDLRGSLRKIHVTIARLQALGEAALSTVNLRLQSSSASDYGYTLAGAGRLDSELRTISVNY